MANGSAPPKKMTISELEAMLASEYAQALGGNKSSELADERETALDYYNGDMTEDMPTTEGRSSAVSMDVQETVEGLMPAMMDIFAASDEVVRFEPFGPEDVEAAEQETDYTNHVLMQKNPGFMILYSFVKDALLSKVGIVKILWDEYEKQTRETYDDQPDDVYTMLAADPDVEIVAHSAHVDENWQAPTASPVDLPSMGAAAPVPPAGPPLLHDITVVSRKTVGCAKVVNVPPEEFGISRWSRSLVDATYTYHRTRPSVADLIEQGFDADEVRKLPTSTSVDASQEELARDTVGEESNETGAGNEANLSSRRVEAIEHYCLCDYDGSGAQGMWRITTGAGDVLTLNGKPAVERVDDHPFAGMTPVIITHRFFGKSIADLVLDIQKIKTALFRGLLDNVYLSNNNRLEVAEALSHERTIDDLLINRPGAIVRVKQPGAVTPILNQPIGDFVFPLMEFVDQTKEFRTGVSKLGAGQDPNVLQNTTALATDRAFSATQEKRNLIARIFAETGIKDMFSKLHECIRKNDSRENTVRLRNKWVTVNPRDWSERNDMTINVGLGTGSKREKMQALMLVGEQQKLALAYPQFGLVKPPHLYHTAAQILKLMDYKDPTQFFQDPDSPEAQAEAQKMAANPPPNPAMVELQAKLALEKAQAEADIASQDRKVQSEIALAQQKAQIDAQVAMTQAATTAQAPPSPAELAKLELERQKLNLQQQQAATAHVLAVADTRVKFAAHNRQLITDQEQAMTASPDNTGKVPDGPTVVEQIVKSLEAGVARQDQEIAALTAAQQQQSVLLQQLVALAGAPREIVRGTDGRVAGARVVMQ